MSKDVRKWSCVVFTMVYAMMILTILVCIPDLREPVSNGTGIVLEIKDEEYKFTPFLENSSDYIIQEFCPIYKNLESIEIRLANEWTDDVNCTLLFTIRDSDNTILYEEEVSSEAIENWRYYKLNLQNELRKRNTYRLTVQCPENHNPEVDFKIFLCNINLRENGRLTYNGTVIDGELDLIYNYEDVVPASYLLTIIGGCFVCIIIVWLPDIYFKKKYYDEILWAVSLIANFFLVEYLSYGDVTQMSAYSVLINLCILISLSGLLKVIFPSNVWAITFTSVSILLFALVNHYTLQFRGTVILPSDVYSLRAAASVVDHYHIALDRKAAASIVIIMGIILLSVKTNRKSGKDRKKKGIYILMVLISSCLPVAVAVNTEFARKSGVSVAMFRQSERSNEIGFLLNFIENIQYIIVRQPDGYSLEKVEKIVKDNIESVPTITKVEAPNIIMIMNESFTDLRFIGDFESSEEYMENFYRAAQSENSKTGKCVVPVFGSGTSCSEFEALTGSSMMFFGDGNAPYQQYIHSQTDSIAHLLKNQQYDTYAVHAANPKSWNREASYPLLGFDRFISAESKEFEEATYCRYWIDDQSLIDEVILLQDDEDNHMFIFALTIQCHGGYAVSNYEADVEVKGLSDAYEEVNQYLSLVKENDEAFGTLIRELEGTDRPTIVLMFGDHLPKFTSDFYNEIRAEGKSGNNAEVLEMYMTPYIFWANYDVDLSSVPDILSANYLGTYLLLAAGREMDDYNKYLYTLSRKYPVVSKYGILNSEGCFLKYETDASCYEDIHNYEIMQYYNLFVK